MGLVISLSLQDSFLFLQSGLIEKINRCHYCNFMFSLKSSKLKITLGKNLNMQIYQDIPIRYKISILYIDI